jgi:ABC-type Fe3+-hydroxamate transport system substrate-binding protein
VSPGPLRVVSLVPSVTETLLAWGVTPVACTRFCEQPGLLHVGGTKDPDVEAIVALAPDLVVVDKEENRREDADALAGHGLSVHATHVTSLADVVPTLTRLATAVRLDGPAPAAAPAAGPLHRIVTESVESTGRRRRAFVPIWRRPWMTLNGDTYGSSLLAAAGVDNVFAGAPTRYPEVTLADAASLRPHLVLAPTEPYPFKPRHLAELRIVAADVRVVDGQDLFWWGVRTPGALERLRQALAS